MGNEQQNGTSHHFINDSPTDEHQPQKHHHVLWTKNGRIPISKQQQSTKSSWQLARDVSMDMLSRKTTKLNIKQGPTPNLYGYRQSTMKKYPLQTIPAPGKPLPIYRVPRMPTEKEVAEIIIAYKVLCEFCGGPCIGDYTRCRICIKTYHAQCLYERGHVNDQSFSLPRLSRQDWSCPDCVDLTRLLNEDEINYLIYVFEQIDRNKDGYIILENFLEFFSNKKQINDHLNLFSSTDINLEKSHFYLMDSRQKGAVTWWNFALFYSCKLIAAKNKTFLTTKLTVKELVFAKNLFLKDPRIKIDNESNLIITKEHLNRVIYDLMLMIKKKYGGNFIDAILHENQTMDETTENLSVMDWDEFLRQISVLIILNRVNSDIKTSQLRRTSFSSYLPKKPNIISHMNLNSNSVTSIVNISSDFSTDESFRKHGKILEKLNQKQIQEELRKKQFGSIVDWSIIEDIDEQNNSQLPKLKPNARDERKTITEPWSMVKDMQQLRNQPILITHTRYQMVKV